jgi:hypothetical protein
MGPSWPLLVSCTALCVMHTVTLCEGRGWSGSLCQPS